MRKDSGFTKENSLILKGIFTLFLLFHHLFIADTIDDWSIDICLNNAEIFKNLTIYGKVCVQGFAFISAFGITHQLMKVCQGGFSIRESMKVTIRRLFKLESSCLFIYIIAVLYKRFVIYSSIKDVYLDVSGIFRPVYMLLNALGLAELFGTPRINATWWYLSYAILIIFSVPAIYVIYEKIGIYSIPVVLLIKPEILSLFLGVAFAKDNGFDKLSAIGRKNVKYKIFSVLMCVFLLYVSYELTAGRKQVDEVQGWVCVLWAYIAIVYVSGIPIISNLLKIIGKHSGNIFLTHTFIYLYFYKSFIYSFKKDYLILEVLLLLSIAISIVLEFVKKITKYNAVVDKLINKILFEKQVDDNLSKRNSSFIR